MKKYVWCFLLFSGTTALCALMVFWIAGSQGRREMAPPAAETTAEYIRAAADQEQVSHAAEDRRYLLVERNGMLVVLEAGDEDHATSTHMPASAVPRAERERLSEGIWFSTMMEIYSYLESCTS